MLVLTRREDQSILIGNEIQVVILRVGRKQVSVGIAAPPQVVVLRNELNTRSRALLPSRGNQK